MQGLEGGGGGGGGRDLPGGVETCQETAMVKTKVPAETKAFGLRLLDRFRRLSVEALGLQVTFSMTSD